MSKSVWVTPATAETDIGKIQAHILSYLHDRRHGGGLSRNEIVTAIRGGGYSEGRAPGTKIRLIEDALEQLATDKRIAVTVSRTYGGQTRTTYHDLNEHAATEAALNAAGMLVSVLAQAGVSSSQRGTSVSLYGTDHITKLTEIVRDYLRVRLLASQR